MKSVTLIPYMSPELENIMFECNDIITISDDYVEGGNTNNGYEDDENIDNDWQKSSHTLNLGI